MAAQTDILSLYELNSLIKETLRDGFPELYWIRAETSDVRINQNGHCYLEFIEKDAQGRNTIARSRAVVWFNTFNLLRMYFESETGQPFASGIKVLVQVSVEYHELYGMSLTVHDIDPAYTLGDQAINRAAILRQLEQDGVIDLNKELVLPMVANRIAIISSPTAAGYEDFCDQLYNNIYGFIFYTKLFPAIMQGDRAEDSIIAALEEIYAHQECFDAVVIIRGGGATSELSCFDSYLLAASCAQFPLPVITGIGHERDETVLDIVAHTRAKTPTAVAEFLIGNMGNSADELIRVTNGIINGVERRLQDNVLLLNSYRTQLIFLMKGWSKEQSNILMTFSSQLKKIIPQKLKNGKSELEMIERHLNLISPDNILKKGYTLTFKNGKVLKTASVVEVGDVITTRFADGEIDSIIK